MKLQLEPKENSLPSANLFPLASLPFPFPPTYYHIWRSDRKGPYIETEREKEPYRNSPIILWARRAWKCAIQCPCYLKLEAPLGNKEEFYNCSFQRRLSRQEREFF